MCEPVGGPRPSFELRPPGETAGSAEQPWGVTAHAAPPPRKFGIDQGKVEVPPEFFEPLPDDILRYFTGENTDEGPAAIRI